MSSSNESILQSTVITESGDGVAFSSLLEDLTLCIFLRHWGCTECNLLLHTLTPRLSELVELHINILFVGLGSAEGISEFRSKHRLKKNRVVIVTDPTLSIHKKILNHIIYLILQIKNFKLMRLKNLKYFLNFTIK